MENLQVLVEKPGLVTVNRFCPRCVQINLIKNGVSLYFTNEAFVELSEALYQGASNLLDINLSEMLD